MHLFSDTSRDYLAFAEEAADSPCFTDWARRVAADTKVLAWLADLPAVKRQANLVFAAARWHGVAAPGPYAGLRDALLGDDGTLRATVLTRSTQTNEVRRLATLTPLLARIQHEEDERPLALLEVGASAGLCLYPDRYDYSWPPLGELTGSGGPVLGAEVTGPVPLPTRPVEVASRSGIDLHPLDVTDDEDVAWLTTLVWPEQDDRRERLLSAVQVARTDPPRLVAGDLLSELPRQLDRLAADDVAVVVMHSAVVAYLEPEDRRRFVDLMTAEVGSGRCRWVSNEAPHVLPGVRRPPGDGGHRFVLALDGVGVAWAHGHGADLLWA